MNYKSGVLALVSLLAGTCGTYALNAGEGLPFVSNSYWAVSVQGSVGLVNGMAQEDVYSNVRRSRYHLSELDWDISNVVMVGAEVSVAFTRDIWLNAGFWGAATQGNGQMNDWDWLLEEPGSPWTDWSLSSVDMTSAWLLDLNINYELTRFGALGVRGILGYKYNTWSWQDHGIQHVYSTDPGIPGGFRNDIASDPPGTAVTYEQVFHIPYVGAGVNYSAGRWNVDAYALYSPLVFATDRDRHLTRQLTFQEDFRGGQYFGAGVRGTYNFANNYFATLALDGQIIPEIYGDSTVTDTVTGQSESSTGTAGLRNQVWMLSLGVGRKF